MNTCKTYNVVLVQKKIETPGVQLVTIADMPLHGNVAAQIRRSAINV